MTAERKKKFYNFDFRSDTECKFAHPAANVEVQNGRVTACYDSIKVSHSFNQIYTNFLIIQKLEK